MSDSHNEFENLVGPAESQRVMASLKRGASRRDVLKMLMAGGMQATLAGSLAGSLAGTAVSAYAQTPRRGGRIRVAAATAATPTTAAPMYTGVKLPAAAPAAAPAPAAWGAAGAAASGVDCANACPTRPVMRTKASSFIT